MALKKFGFDSLEATVFIEKWGEDLILGDVDFSSFNYPRMDVTRYAPHTG